jgi:hypothetical protein
VLWEEPFGSSGDSFVSGSEHSWNDTLDLLTDECLEVPLGSSVDSSETSHEHSWNGSFNPQLHRQP